MAKIYTDYGLQKINGVPYYGGYSKGQFERGGLGVWVDKYTKIFDTDEYYAKISYLVTANSPIKSHCDFRFSELGTKGYTYYADRGVDVTFATQQLLEGYIHSECNKVANVHFEHANLGWGNNSKCKAEEDKLRTVYKHYSANLGNGRKSAYREMFDIKPTGTYEAWMEGVTNHVLGHRPLEAAIVMGLSAVVVGYFGSKKMPPNLVFSLVGTSSTGKSTAAMLAASTTGSPSLNAVNGRYTLMNTWNATENAILALLRGNRGAVLCLDELGSFKGKDFSQMIYRLYAGNDKARLDKNADLPTTLQAYWNTSIISTGEITMESLLRDKADGILMRVFEFTDLKTYVMKDDQKVTKRVCWTKSAANANCVQDFTRKNYGHAAPRLAQYIRKIGYKEMVKMYNQCKKYYRKHRLIQDSLTDRRSEFMAMVLVTARLIKDGLGIDISWKKIAQFFILNEETQVPEHVRAYQFLVELPASNPQCFVDADQEQQTFKPKTVWGKIQRSTLKSNQAVEVKGKKVIGEIAFLPNEFKRLLREQGYPNASRVLKGLEKDQLLSCDGDRPTRNHKNPLTNKKQLYYVIREFEEKN